MCYFVKNQLYVVGLLLLLLVASCTNKDYNSSWQNKELNKNWEFRQAKTNDWLPAHVPGCVYTDLMTLDMIPDPYFADNEKEVQWIEKEDWEYRTTFNADSALFYSNCVNIVFEGLDTYADIYVNNFLVGSTNNMFRKWRFDLKKHIGKGSNSLRVYFHSPVKKDKTEAEKLPYTLPDERVFSRKAPYQSGWDWGPRLVTSGIWKDVRIESCNFFKFEDIRINSYKISEDKADLFAEVELKATHAMTIELELFDKKKNRKLSSYTTEVVEGHNSFAWNFEIKKPKLWWPHNMGTPYLYDLELRAINDDVATDTIISIGLRSIELVQKKDSVGVGFAFRVNGKELFAKGANYIPQDNFPHRVENSTYENLIENTIAANMNMLRVWGGGIYENDIFYDLCDKHGVLVWQDFMYACAMYPGDLAFLDNAKEEATQAIKRIRNHACLALWCGNNEVDNGWKDWGWQKALGYSNADSTTIYNHYKKLFEEILPELVLEFDENTPYWPSSPQYGWGHKECNTHGDSHYWGVWWGKEPFEVYEEKVGRFMSEYGFQAYPDYQTVRTFCSADDLYMFSDELKNHQKHPTGNETITEYMDREYPVSDSLFVFTYLSQILQADGIATAIEAHRRAMPHCMGTLYWQLNDCWPVVSWSSVDYFGRWKALHYKARDLYKNYMLSVSQSDSLVDIFVVSDSIKDIKAELQVDVMDFNGNSLFAETIELNVPSNRSQVAEQYLIEDLIPDSLLNTGFINLSLSKGRKTLATAQHYFTIPKELNLPEAAISMKASQYKKGYEITLSSPTLVKNLMLFTETAQGHFSDNYFDLLPGKEKTVLFSTESIGELNTNDFRFLHLGQVGK